MTQITAQLNYLRISPRKVRAVAELLKGLDVDLAEAQLKYLVRKPAKPLLKLLNSAASNAKNNLGLDKNYLYIKNITVNEGMKLKRYKPKGFGLSMPIQKKTSHIKIVLGEISAEKRKKKEAFLAKFPRIEEKKGVKAEEKKEIKTEQKQKIEKAKREVEKVSRPKRGFGGIKSFGRRLFRRKSI
ncbi:MAG: large subunit ribosomal protein L22 [Parcubacteria group bacterium Gr01-1014_2]|nr:MAG: large subunit ribosomal protein L22 [Parcubacteria group bacterium Gr01-1014_2]